MAKGRNRIEQKEQKERIDPFKKAEDNKGIFYEKIGTINNKKKSKGLTEAEQIKKKWRE